MEVSIPDPVEVFILGRGVIAHHTREVRPARHALNVAGTECVHEEYTTAGRTKCDSRAEIARHGFCCPKHTPRGRRVKLGTIDTLMVEAADIIRRDKSLIRYATPAIGGHRVGDKYNLKRASIYRSDGSPKFPW